MIGRTKPFDVADLVQPDIFLPSQFVDRNWPLVRIRTGPCYGDPGSDASTTLTYTAREPPAGAAVFKDE